jgi:hypothetical protein
MAKKDKEDKQDYPAPFYGVGKLLEGIPSLLKWVAILVVLCIVLGLTAVGFAVAWWLE